MAKPLPAPRTPGQEETDGTQAGTPNPPGQTGGEESGRPQAPPGRAAQLQRSPGQVRSPSRALRAQGGSARAGRGGAADLGFRGAAPDAARTADSRVAPGCRAGRGERVGAGRRGGCGLGHKDPEQRLPARAVGAAPRAGSPVIIDPVQRAAARVRGRRVGAVPCPGARSGVGRLRARRSLLSPRGSRPPRQAGGSSVPAAGSGRARAFVCGEGAGTRCVRSSSLRPDRKSVV